MEYVKNVPEEKENNDNQNVLRGVLFIQTRRQALGVIFLPGQMIRPKTVIRLVDGYTPINNLMAKH